MATFRITKLDAAQRQLETAVSLFASGGDPVAIHGLALAAHEVLRGLNHAGGGSPMLSEAAALVGLDPSQAEIVVTRARRARNFIKHADKDPTSSFDFDPEDVECFLYEACAKHHDLAARWSRPIKTYVCWFIAQRPNLFRWTPAMSSLCDRLASLRAQESRAGFFARVNALIERGEV
jgi:hypothetical protein